MTKEELDERNRQLLERESTSHSKRESEPAKAILANINKGNDNDASTSTESV